MMTSQARAVRFQAKITQLRQRILRTTALGPHLSRYWMARPHHRPTRSINCARQSHQSNSPRPHRWGFSLEHSAGRFVVCVASRNGQPLAPWGTQRWPGFPAARTPQPVEAPHPARLRGFFMLGRARLENCVVAPCTRSDLLRHRLGSRFPARCLTATIIHRWRLFEAPVVPGYFDFNLPWPRTDHLPIFAAVGLDR